MKFAELPAMLFLDEQPKQKADYVNLPEREIYRLINAAEVGQESADTDHEWFLHTTNLQRLHAVLDERRF